MKYLIWSIEHNAWWMPNQHGYTSQKWEAGRYDRAHAESICLAANEFNGDKPNEALVPDL